MLSRALLFLPLAAACGPAPIALELPYGNGAHALLLGFQQGQACSFSAALEQLVAIDLDTGAGGQQLPELRVPNAEPAYQLRATALLYHRPLSELAPPGALQLDEHGSPLAVADEIWEAVLSSAKEPQWHQSERADLALCSIRIAGAAGSPLSCDSEPHGCPK